MNTIDGMCPSCNEYVGDGPSSRAYCPNCGQTFTNDDDDDE